MRGAALLAAYLLSLALLALETAGGAWSTLPGSQLGLVALVWIALAGMPGAARPERGPSAAVVTLACALPLLALAAGLDLRRGAPPGELALAALVGLLLLALACARPIAGRLLYALLWLALAPGLPLLAAALAWGAQREGARAPALLELARDASPLGWSYALARELVAERTAPSPWGALAVGLLLFVAARVNRSRAHP